MSGLFSGEQLELSFDVPVARLRVCRLCEEPKPDCDFHAWLMKPGRNPPCKTCYRKQKRRQYAKSPGAQEKARKQASEYQCKLVSTPDGHAKKLEQKKRYRDSKKGQNTNKAYAEKYLPRRAELEVKYRHQAKQSRKLSKRQCVALKRRIRRRLERKRLTLKRALHDWFCLQASDEWLDKWFVGPYKILDHRRTDAQRYKYKYQNDVAFNIQERLRNQLKKGLHVGRQSFSKSLGYSMSDARRHIGSLFVRGMNWDAYRAGLIHIDHRIPKCNFDHTEPDEAADCWSLDNLQPLWYDENSSKSSRCCVAECDPVLWSKYGHRVDRSLLVDTPVWQRDA